MPAGRGAVQAHQTAFRASSVTCNAGNALNTQVIWDLGSITVDNCIVLCHIVVFYIDERLKL